MSCRREETDVDAHKAMQKFIDLTGQFALSKKEKIPDLLSFCNRMFDQRQKH